MDSGFSGGGGGGTCVSRWVGIASRVALECSFFLNARAYLSPSCARSRPRAAPQGDPSACDCHSCRDGAGASNKGMWRLRNGERLYGDTWDKITDGSSLLARTSLLRLSSTTVQLVRGFCTVCLVWSLKEENILSLSVHRDASKGVSIHVHAHVHVCPSMSASVHVHVHVHCCGCMCWFHV